MVKNTHVGNKTQQMVIEKVIWQETGGKWSRKCPGCGDVLYYKQKDKCVLAQKANRKCGSCSKIGVNNGARFSTTEQAQFVASGKAARLEKTARRRDPMLTAGLIRSRNQLWEKNCPNCGKVQQYKSIHHCLNAVERDIRCNSCAKTGSNNPQHGKPVSTEVRLKLSGSLMGLKRGPCPKERRAKISRTKRLNRATKASDHNGNNQYTRKIFTFPNGRSEEVQGYENWTLALLLHERVDPSDIHVKGKERPIIPFVFKGDTFIYIPDCYVKSTNTIIETKSKWTWLSNISVNKAKMHATIAAHYKYRLVVWSPKQTRLIDHTFQAQTA